MNIAATSNRRISYNSKRPMQVSICIPVKNTFPYLEERKQSILDQTFDDYEVIVVDDDSTDGSREFFEQWSREDHRVSVYDGPGEGLYPGWNAALKKARGNYVYIATSDDTMAANFLEVMVKALDQNPEVAIAHAPLKVIGRNADQFNKWWAEQSPFVMSADSQLDQLYLRRAPLDGILHLFGISLYISTTQLLFRRKTIEDLGYYPTSLGSLGDYAFNCKAGLQYDILHVPGTWGGFRAHENQATSVTAKKVNLKTACMEIAEPIIHEFVSSSDTQKHYRKIVEEISFFNNLFSQEAKIAKITLIIKAIASGRISPSYYWCIFRYVRTRSNQSLISHIKRRLKSVSA